MKNLNYLISIIVIVIVFLQNAKVTIFNEETDKKVIVTNAKTESPVRKEIVIEQIDYKQSKENNIKFKDVGNGILKVSGIFDPINNTEKTLFSLQNYGLNGVINSRNNHYGVDYKTRPTINIPLIAPEKSEVLFAGNTDNGYGNLIILQAGQNTYYYAHLQKIYVSKGQQLTFGDEIGVTGSTGKITGPHLHFGLFNNGMISTFDWGYDVKLEKILEVYGNGLEIDKIVKFAKENPKIDILKLISYIKITGISDKKEYRGNKNYLEALKIDIEKANSENHYFSGDMMPYLEKKVKTKFIQDEINKLTSIKKDILIDFFKKNPEKAPEFLKGKLTSINTIFDNKEIIGKKVKATKIFATKKIENKVIIKNDDKLKEKIENKRNEIANNKNNNSIIVGKSKVTFEGNIRSLFTKKETKGETEEVKEEKLPGFVSTIDDVQVLACWNKKLEKVVKTKNGKCGVGEANISGMPKGHYKIWKSVFGNNPVAIANRMPMVNFESYWDNTRLNKSCIERKGNGYKTSCALGYVQIHKQHNCIKRNKSGSCLKRGDWAEFDKNRRDIVYNLNWLKNRSQNLKERFCNKKGTMDGIVRCINQGHYGYVNSASWYGKRGMEVAKFYRSLIES